MRMRVAFLLVCVLVLSSACKREESPEMLRIRALDARQSEDWQGVVDHNTKLLELNSADYDALQDRADAYYQLGKYHESLVDYDALLEVKTTDAALFYGRCNSRLELNDIEGAREDLVKASHLIPHDDQVHRDLGLVYFVENNLDEAVRSFDRAIKIDRYDLVSRAFRAQANVARGNYESSVLDLEVTLTVLPTHAISLSAFGQVRENQGKPWLAREFYESAYKSEPGNSVNIARLAILHARMGEFERAWKVIDEYDAALAADDYMVRTTSVGYPAYHRAHIALIEQDEEKIAKYIAQAEKTKLREHLLLWLKVEFHEIKRDFNAALKLAEEYTRSAPEESAAWYHKGYCLFRLNKYEEAAEALKQARRLRPLNANYNTMSAICALHLGDDDAAREFATAAAAVDGTPVKAHCMLASLRNAAGLRREGMRAANDAVNTAEDWMQNVPKRAMHNRYDLACAYASRINLWDDTTQSAKDETKALDHLAVAMELGFDDLDWIHLDPGMDPLRRVGRFTAMTRE